MANSSGRLLSFSTDVDGSKDAIPDCEGATQILPLGPTETEMIRELGRPSSIVYVFHEVPSNLDIPSFKPQKNRTKGFYAEVPIALKLKGTYHDVAIFFEKVGNMERIMNIQNVTMKPERERSTILNVTCNAITYTFIKGN